MLDLDKVTLRWGHDARFLNVDYNCTEIGHLKFNARGESERVEALPRSHYSPVVQLLSRCARALGQTEARAATAVDLDSEPSGGSGGALAASRGSRVQLDSTTLAGCRRSWDKSVNLSET